MSRIASAKRFLGRPRMFYTALEEVISLRNAECKTEEKQVMFTDELRKESKRTETPKHELSQEEKEQQKRAEAVRSGALSSAIYEALKQELMRYVKERNLLNLPQDNHYSYHCIYHPEEYRKKEKVHKSKYNKQYEERLKSAYS